MSTPFFRKCIQITAQDSPNIQAGERGDKDYIPLPGLSYDEYLHRRKTWDPQRQCEGLDAKWYAGPALKLTPESWLDEAAKVCQRPPGYIGTRWMGNDPGEGGDDTAWVIGDWYGVLHVESYPTPDTNDIVHRSLSLARTWNVVAENMIFDRGGGGKEHADRLRAMGWPVRTIGFGQAVSLEPKRGMTMFPERKDVVEDKYAYVNRRSEMFYEIRLLLERDGDLNALRKPSYHLPMPMCKELIRQLTPIPLKWDDEGRFKLIPKQDATDPQNQETFRYLLGRSPDIADAFALMIHGMLHKPTRQTAGAS